MINIDLKGNNIMSIHIKSDIDIDNLTRSTIDFDLILDRNEYLDGVGISGDDAIWFPLSEEFGLKLIKDNSKSLMDNIKYIQEIDSEVFPHINWVEQIDDYCKERNNTIDAETFFDFYESKNWKIGKSAMKCWKSCVRTWEKRQTKNNKKS